MSDLTYKPKKFTIEYDERKFIYDNSKLVSVQAQMALVLGQYIEDYNKSGKHSMRDVVNSDRNEAIDTIVSHLVCEIKEGKPLPYDKDYSTDHIKPLMLNLPLEFGKVKAEIVDDFFLSQGKSHLASTLLQKESFEGKINKLLLLTQMGNMKENSEPEQPSSSESAQPSKEAKQKDG